MIDVQVMLFEVEGTEAEPDPAANTMSEAVKPETASVKVKVTVKPVLVGFGSVELKVRPGAVASYVTELSVLVEAVLGLFKASWATPEAMAKMKGTFHNH